MKKMITAAIGGALLAGSPLGAGAANADVYYKNCSEARAAGVTPFYEGEELDPVKPEFRVKFGVL